MRYLGNTEKRMRWIHWQCFNFNRFSVISEVFQIPYLGRVDGPKNESGALKKTLQNIFGIDLPYFHIEIVIYIESFVCVCI